MGADTQLGQKVLLFFTNTYPFAPGEEFIEAEVQYLADAFDRVVLIPSFPYLREGFQREIPENFTLLVPAALDGSRKNYPEIARFCMRHPIATLRAVGNALKKVPTVGKMLEDFKLDLFSRMVVESVREDVAKLISPRDELVFYSYWMYAPARVALQLRDRLRRRRVPVVTRAHGYDVFAERRSSNYLPQRELLFRGLKAVFTVSENGARYLRQRYSKFQDKVGTRRLGVAPATNGGNPTQEKGLVYSCAYLHPVKRIPLLIDGLAAAQAKGIVVSWAHIGSSAEADAVRAIEDYAAEKLLPGTFKFLGNLSNDEVRAEYARNPGMVFVNTSESEGTPVSIMEAIAQGLPVIATDVGGNSELIAPELGMFEGLIDSNPTPESIAERLELLMVASQEEYLGFVAGSLTTWKQRWSSSDNYRSFAEYLRSLAAI